MSLCLCEWEDITGREEHEAGVGLEKTLHMPSTENIIAALKMCMEGGVGDIGSSCGEKCQR